MPGQWLWFAGGEFEIEPEAGELWGLVAAGASSLLANPATWIGALVGVALLFGAIELRRRVSE